MKSCRTMQPLLTISIGMLIYLGLSYIVYGIFAISDEVRPRHKEDLPAPDLLREAGL